MSYFSIAIKRAIERRQMNQSELARQSRISVSYISRLLSGEHQDLADSNFIALLNVFAADPRSQAEIIAARMQDILSVPRTARVPGADLVDLSIKSKPDTSPSPSNISALPQVELSADTERAFAWLKSQCPVNPELEKHLVGYARMLGMK